MMSSRSNRRMPTILGSCFLPLIAVILLGIVVFFGLLLSVPERATARFGAPRAGLGKVQRYFLSTTLLWKSEALTQPINPSGGEIQFTIALGESTPSVIGRLWEAGLLPDPGAFRAYLQYTGLDTSLQAGEYQLSPAMNAIQIAQALQVATPGQAIFTLLAGWRLEEAAAAIPTTGLEFSPQAFLSAAQFHPQDIAFMKEIPPGATLEGFLFPGSYEVPRETTAPALILLMLKGMADSLTPELQSGFANQGLTLYQAITLASIIEREAVDEEEMPLIASVFVNRLEAGMNLAADPTVQYAIGYNDVQKTWWTNPLSATDLQFDSPYNTYLYPGFPPSPIANPGSSALRATAFPAQTSYYYFRALCDGSGRHVFAETYEQHLQNACTEAP